MPFYAHARLLLLAMSLKGQVEPPETWDDLLEVTAKINKHPIDTGRCSSVMATGSNPLLIYLAPTNGTCFFDENFNELNSRVIETVKFLVDREAVSL